MMDETNPEYCGGMITALMMTTDFPLAAEYIERYIRLKPEDDREGNSSAHIKASVIGVSAVVFVEEGKLVLGTWQSIFFCEFDGPRHRRVSVKFTAGDRKQA